MAEALLKAWGAPPMVSEVKLDGAAGALIRASGAEASGVKRSEKGLSWTETESALPLPVNLYAQIVRPPEALLRLLDWEPCCWLPGSPGAKILGISLR